MIPPVEAAIDNGPIAGRNAAAATVIPVHTRAWLLGLAAVLALVAGYGMWRIQLEYPSHWARLLPHVAAPESPQIDLLRALQQISDADGPKADARLPLAEFVQSNGSRIRIVLVQGQFFDRSIEPLKIWRMRLGGCFGWSVDDWRHGRPSP